MSLPDTWPLLNDQLYGMFELSDPKTFPDRFRAIKNRATKQQIDNGPVALANAISIANTQGFTNTVHNALKEVERLYNLEKDNETLWDGLMEIKPPKKQKRRKKRK